MCAAKGPEIFIRFGLQRKREFLKDLSKAYDGLVIPANILLYQYKATPLVIYMCQGKPFFVDPMSYLFGQPYEEFKRKVRGVDEFKPSFSKLMENHGLDVKSLLPYSYEKLLGFIHSSAANLKIFVDSCLSFQRNTILDNFKKYIIDVMPEKPRYDEKDFLPSFLIPPYFLYQN